VTFPARRTGFAASAIPYTRYAKIRWFSNPAVGFPMPLPPPVPRRARHRRAINVEAFEREDGLWDIEACLTDRKARDTTLAAGVRPAGLPIHELWLRVTVDLELNIVDAQSSSEWVPYPGHCESANPAYRALIGLNLRRGFRRAAQERLGGTGGCTHLTELCAVLPTAAIQAFVGEVWSNGSALDGHAGEQSVPFQLDRCQALRRDGPAVQQFYPRWFRPAPDLAARARHDAETGIAQTDIHSNSQTEGNHA
jgi:Protein of unknown function (DUF2889)